VQGVAVGPTGEIYLADADDHRLRRIGLDGRITTLAGDGLPGRDGDGGPATAARLNTPYGISLGARGEVYIADLGNSRVRRIASDGTIATIAGGGVPGATLQSPRNVLAAPDGRVYISDFASHRVLILEPRGNFNQLPDPSPRFQSPAGLALDPSGNLYIVDSGNARVLRYSTQGVYTVVASGLEVPTGLAWHPSGYLLIANARGDFLTRVEAGQPPAVVSTGGRDVAVDRSARIVVAGGTWVRRTAPSGLVDLLVGNLFQTFRGENVPGPAARLFRPSGVARDSQGRIYFADSQNHRIRCLDSQGLVRTVAGTGEPGFRGDGGPALSAQLNSPGALAVDAFDNLYIADTGNHRVRVLSPAGAIRTVAGTGRVEFSADNQPASEAALVLPSGLAIDSDGRIYVSERGSHRVRRFTPGGAITTVAGTGVRGVPVENSSAILASLNEPMGIALDPVGDLYVADRSNHALRVVDAKTGRLRTLLTNLRAPESLAVSPAGVVYFSESQTHTISRLTPGGPRNLIAGRVNENGFNAENGDATALTLNEPTGLALIGESTLLFADRLNDRIRCLEAPATQSPELSISPFRILNAASFAPGPLAPGLLVSVFTPPTPQPERTEVTVDGFRATIGFASATQVNFQVPYAVAGRPAAAVEFRQSGQLLDRQLLPVAAAAPALFELSSPKGQVVAVLPNGQLNSEANPARPGDIVVLYATGEGLRTDRNGVEAPFLPAAVEINGLSSEVLYAGAAAGFGGVMQINVRIPASLRGAGSVAVVLRVGGYRNPPAQTIFVF
jgi:uncharacterized protein (TIGR03437 family)